MNPPTFYHVTFAEVRIFYGRSYMSVCEDEIRWWHYGVLLRETSDDIILENHRDNPNWVEIT